MAPELLKKYYRLCFPTGIIYKFFRNLELNDTLNLFDQTAFSDWLFPFNFRNMTTQAVNLSLISAHVYCSKKYIIKFYLELTSHYE